MLTHTSEIRVALVGYVSVGKSTVLNALLGDKFSEVALKRTTAGVNIFRIIQPTEGEDEESIGACDATIREASDVHRVIEEDNQQLRSSDTVGEKTFDVCISHTICKMRKDIRLVLIDIPGINEAESSKKYKDYVNSKWKSFDCVVVVMDAIQGVNTEEQVDLLNFVENNIRTSKNVPAIILGNKMDDPDDDDTIQLMEETCLKTMEIFGNVHCQSMPREVKHKNVTSPSNNGKETSKTVFIPLSAKNAYAYMKAGNLNIDQLGTAEYEDIVNKIGSDEFGRKWSRMNDKDKIVAVFEILNDPAELKERLEGTNFFSLIAAFSDVIGGDVRQREIIATQIELRLKDMRNNRYDTETISESILEVFQKGKAIGITTTHDLFETFWTVYQNFEDEVFRERLETKVDPKPLVRPFLELEHYHKMARDLRWEKESARAIDSMKQLLRRQLLLVLSKMEEWSFESYCKASGAYDVCVNTFKCVHNCTGCQKVCRNSANYGWCGEISGVRIPVAWKSPEIVEWPSLLPEECICLLESLSVVLNHSKYVEGFGSEVAKINSVLMSFLVTFRSVNGFNLGTGGVYGKNRNCLYLCAYQDEIQKNGKQSDVFSTRFKVPDSWSDPSHWGFLSWKYIKFCNSRGSED